MRTRVSCVRIGDLDSLPLEPAHSTRPAWSWSVASISNATRPPMPAIFSFVPSSVRKQHGMTIDYEVHRKGRRPAIVNQHYPAHALPGKQREALRLGQFVPAIVRHALTSCSDVRHLPGSWVHPLNARGYRPPRHGTIDLTFAVRGAGSL